MTKIKALLFLFTLLQTSIPVSTAWGIEKPGIQAIEVGIVSWLRDLDLALEMSKKQDKPILLLFQEVPGCSGCKTFGTEVLSDLDTVRQIEKDFIPLLVYNNHRGKDAKILKQFNEPSWNFQVIRFLDQQGKDVIPRKDRIWKLEETRARMNLALQAYKARKK